MAIVTISVFCVVGIAIDRYTARIDFREAMNELFRYQRERMGRIAVVAIRGFLATEDSIRRGPMVPELQTFTREGLGHLLRVSRTKNPMNGDAEAAKTELEELRTALVALGRPDLEWVRGFQGPEVHSGNPRRQTTHSP